jgi:hypothetical protein
MNLPTTIAAICLYVVIPAPMMTRRLANKMQVFFPYLVYRSSLISMLTNNPTPIDPTADPTEQIEVISDE